MTRVESDEQSTGRPTRRTGLLVKAVDLKKARAGKSRARAAFTAAPFLGQQAFNGETPQGKNKQKPRRAQSNAHGIYEAFGDEDAIGYAQFIAGFMNCIHQIQKYAMVEADPEIKERYRPLVDQLMAHLKRFTNETSGSVSFNFPSSPNSSDSPVSHVTDDAPVGTLSLSTCIKLHASRLPHSRPVIALEGCSESRETNRQTPGSLWRPW
ncbi:hypothetical protein M513_04321 [Trichuris suis]|uniref:Uncharacterized protein n=1 Tax=Trichuris suis TaxID=68888 RepID=A0A085MCE1_9BILA|nr:hypothetical protein M513_04321 [Trichuris suis]